MNQQHIDPVFADDERGIEEPVFDMPDESRDLPDNGPPQYPLASRFAAASSANYRTWRVSSPRPIELIVIHITDGHADIEGPIQGFQKPGRQASAHYVVGQDGEVVQMVRHDDIAWHATAANQTSIGIEHCARSPGELSRHSRPGTPPDPGLPVTPEQYAASAQLVAWLCRQFNLPMDRDHIKGHCEAVKTSHEDCPNRIWDWEGYMALVVAS